MHAEKTKIETINYLQLLHGNVFQFIFSKRNLDLYNFFRFIYLFYFIFSFLLFKEIWNVSEISIKIRL